MKIKLVDATLMTKGGADTLGFYQKLLKDNLLVEVWTESSLKGVVFQRSGWT
jgi:hypothetical protein